MTDPEQALRFRDRDRIEGTFVREFTHAPVGPLKPNGRRVVWQLLNIFVTDDQGRILKEWASADNATGSRW